MRDSLTETSLKFFGAVTASISHEIKNRMAIINEQAGLLDDLVGMSRQGRALDPDRLTRLADSVKTQIGLADGIIRNMNRFAHTVDVFRQASDMNELLLMAGSLANRMAERGGVRLEIRPAEAPVKADTSPFLVLNLIWRCLEQGIAASGKGRSLLLVCEDAPEGPYLRVRVERVGDEQATLFPTEDIRNLAAELGAEVGLDQEGKALSIRFPR